MNRILLVTAMIAALAAPSHAQIALAGADEMPGYAAGTRRYKVVSTSTMSGAYASNSSSEYHIDVAIASAGADMLAATYTLITPQVRESNGLKALARINPTGKLVSYELLNPRNRDEPLYVEAYRNFLPPHPPSFAPGTEWNVPFNNERKMNIDQFSSMTTTDRITGTYKVAGDTTVNGMTAVKVDYELGGTSTTVSRSSFDKPTTSVATVRTTGVHVFSRDGVYLGTRYSYEMQSGQGAEQIRMSATQLVELVP